jgi:hypothetical protein
MPLYCDLLDPHGQVHAFGHFHDCSKNNEYWCYGKFKHIVGISAPRSIYGGDLIIC